jgi:hypothetical protein
LLPPRARGRTAAEPPRPISIRRTSAAAELLQALVPADLADGQPVVAVDPATVRPDYHILDAGCCGMAGSFGYEAGERFAVSMKAGERVPLPAVRAAEPDALIIADGFSCREQIAHGTHRRALHLAEVMQLTLQNGRVAS